MITYSIIKKSELEGALRLDAEYYQPEYLKVKELLSKSDPALLKDVAAITTGPAYSSEEIGLGFDVPLMRIGDVVNKISIDDWLKLSKKEFDKFHNKKIKNLDIFLSMTGDPPDVGKCNLIDISNAKILAFNQRVAKLTPKISPYYLFAYLSTDIARLQTERNALGIRQRNLGINDLRNTLVFLPKSQNQQVSIDNLIKNYLSELEKSKNLYSQAENLLLEELGLKNFKADEKLWSIVNYSDVKTAGRIDAEYFQTKYEKLISVIRKNKGTALGNLVTLKKGIEPGAEAYQDEGKLFIRVSSVSKQGLIDKDQKYLSEKLYDVFKKEYEPKKGEILLTKDASPGMAYALDESVQGIISGGILRLKLKEDVIPEYVALCINSVVGQMQVERDSGGSIIAHWKPEQVKSLLIPILSEVTQQKIAELVRESHAARKKSKELLEEAKRKVEEMIENSK